MSDTSDLREARKAWRDRNSDGYGWGDEVRLLERVSPTPARTEELEALPASTRRIGTDETRVESGYAIRHVHVWAGDDPDA